MTERYPPLEKAAKWLHGQINRWPTSQRLLAWCLVVLIAAGLVTAGSVILLIPQWRSKVEFAAFAMVILLTGVFLMTVSIIVATNYDRMRRKRLGAIRRFVRAQLAGEITQLSEVAEEHDITDGLQADLEQLIEVYDLSLRRREVRATRLRMLNLIAATINRTFDLQAVFDVSLQQALINIGWDLGAMYMWDERVDQLNMVTYVGLPEEGVRELYAIDSPDEIAMRAAITQRPIIKHNRNSEAPVDDIGKASRYGQSHCAVPLVVVPDKLLGTIYVAKSTPGPLDNDEYNLLTTVANQVALAVEKAHLYMTVSRHADDLEKQVAIRTQELANAIHDLSVALDKAQEAERVKSLLLSTVSHELRTPLATIKGSTSLLLEHIEQLPPADAKAHLTDIEEETDKLTELIQNLLEMSRIEGGALHIERDAIDIRSVIQGSINAARIRLENTYTSDERNTIHFDADKNLSSIYGDPRRIDQIMANLLDNAVKYSPVGTPIVVKAKQQGTDVMVSVIDRGKGVPAAHKERIFDRFYQVSGQGDSRRQGIGLGLAICKGLVEAHGGQIWVEDNQHNGATFVFTLPAAGSESD